MRNKNQPPKKLQYDLCACALVKSFHKLLWTKLYMLKLLDINNRLGNVIYSYE